MIARRLTVGADRSAQREFAPTRGWIVLFVRHRMGLDYRILAWTDFPPGIIAE
jgi:hypothetical protein